MTREQANNYLRSSGFSDEQIETIARAYENSSYNSVKTELDCISRQALKDLGAECIAKCDENGNLIPLGSIDSLPPASTEETGHWIDDEFGSKCSCCGVHTHLDKFDRPMKFKHCSMCGAKMQEVEE